MNKQLLQIYFNWSLNALRGLNPVATDNYLNQHLEAIKTTARWLLGQFNYTPQTIYRGVILHTPVTILPPHPNFTYLSFSEDREIAESFGDPTPTGFGTVYHLGNYGHVITHMPTIEQVLYHHEFAKLFPYEKALLQEGLDASTTIGMQKEVMIIQPVEPFKNIYLHKQLG